MPDARHRRSRRRAADRDRARAPAADPRHLPGRAPHAGAGGVRRKLVFLLAATAALVLLAGPAALGEYRGSDLFGNVAPQSQVAGGLVEQYPLSASPLDEPVAVGVTSPDGVPPMIAQWAAAQLWSVTSFLVKTVIDLFTWAF